MLKILHIAFGGRSAMNTSTFSELDVTSVLVFSDTFLFLAAAGLHRQSALDLFAQ